MDYLTLSSFIDHLNQLNYNGAFEAPLYLTKHSVIFSSTSHQENKIVGWDTEDWNVLDISTERVKGNLTPGAPRYNSPNELKEQLIVVRDGLSKATKEPLVAFNCKLLNVENPVSLEFKWNIVETRCYETKLNPCHVPSDLMNKLKAVLTLAESQMMCNEAVKELLQLYLAKDHSKVTVYLLETQNAISADYTKPMDKRTARKLELYGSEKEVREKYQEVNELCCTILKKIKHCGTMNDLFVFDQKYPNIRFCSWARVAKLFSLKEQLELVTEGMRETLKV